MSAAQSLAPSQLIELVGSARQEMGAAWAGGQPGSGHSEAHAVGCSQLRLDYKVWEPVIKTAHIWKRGHHGVTSTNGNSGLFLLVHSQPWRSVGLHTVVSMGYKEGMLPVRLDCLFDRFTKVLSEKNAADAE